MITGLVQAGILLGSHLSCTRPEQESPGPGAVPEKFTPTGPRKNGPVEIGDAATIHFTAMHTDGTVFETTEGRDPLSFIVGNGMVIRGLEEAVIGMTPGEEKTVAIPSELAYGPRRRDLVMRVKKILITGGGKLRVGRKLNFRQPDGTEVPVTVIRADESTVTLDANHPLAGKDIKMKITVLEIREAQETEEVVK